MNIADRRFDVHIRRRSAPDHPQGPRFGCHAALRRRRNQIQALPFPPEQRLNGLPQTEPPRHDSSQSGPGCGRPDAALKSWNRPRATRDTLRSSQSQKYGHISSLGPRNGVLRAKCLEPPSGRCHKSAAKPEKEWQKGVSAPPFSSQETGVSLRIPSEFDRLPRLNRRRDGGPGPEFQCPARPGHRARRSAPVRSPPPSRRYPGRPHG